MMILFDSVSNESYLHIPSLGGTKKTYLAWRLLLDKGRDELSNTSGYSIDESARPTLSKKDVLIQRRGKCESKRKMRRLTIRKYIRAKLHGSRRITPYSSEGHQEQTSA